MALYLYAVVYLCIPLVCPIYTYLRPLPFVGQFIGHLLIPPTHPISWLFATWFGCYPVQHLPTAVLPTTAHTYTAVPCIPPCCIPLLYYTFIHVYTPCLLLPYTYVIVSKPCIVGPPDLPHTSSCLPQDLHCIITSTPIFAFFITTYFHIIVGPSVH